MRLRNQKLLLITLLFVIFIDSFSYFLTIPVLLRLITQVSNGLFTAYSEETRNFLFGFAISLLPLAYLLSAPIIGYYADRFGRKNILAGCLILAGASFILPILGLFLGSFSLILTSRLLGGISSSSQPIAWAAITDISTHQKKAIYLSFAAFAMTLAMMLGPLCGSYLSNPELGFSNKTPFIFATILVLINFLLVIFVYEERVYQTIMSAQPHKQHSSWKSMVVALRDQRINILLLTLFIYEFAWSLYFQDIPLYLTRAYHFAPEQIFQLTSWGGVCMLFGLLMLYPLAIRYCSLRFITIGTLSLFSLTLLFCAIGKTPLVQWIGIGPMAICVGMAYPSLLALMSNRVHVNQQGWVMGAAAAMLASAWMISALLMGELTNLSLVLPLGLAAFASILAVTLSFRFRKDVMPEYRLNETFLVSSRE